MFLSSVAAALCFLLVCLFLATYQSQKYGRVRLIDWSILAMGGVYGGVWTLIIVYTLDRKNPSWEQWLTPNANLYVIHTLCALVAVLCAQFGWKLTGGVLLGRQVGFCVPRNIYDRRLVSSA